MKSTFMLRGILALFVLCLAFVRPADAADVLPGKAGLCRITLKGQIEPGDVDKLRAAPMAMPVWWYDLEDGRWAAICLDSPGGSLSGALEIAEYVVERRLGTLVDDGAECLSACALIFMFGTTYQHEAVARTHRRLHVGGRLGFHQPDLTLDRSRNYSVDDVEAAFDLAIEATLSFLARAARPRPDVPRPFVDADLLEAMLQHKGQDFYYIDTVNKAGRWDIDLFGFEAPEISEAGLYYACQNMTAWNAQLAANQVPYDPDGYSARIDVAPGQAGFAGGRRYRIDMSGMMTFACEAGLRQNGTAVLCGYRENLSSRVGPESCLTGKEAPDPWPAIPAAAVFPADTPLVDVKAQHGTSSVAPVIGANACYAPSGRARVINVQSFTSLRNSPSTQAQRVAKLPLGREYQIKHAPIGDFRHPRHRDCKDLCKEAAFGRAHDAAALQACIDENWLWFSIKDASGQSGFASARYLDY